MYIHLHTHTHTHIQRHAQTQQQQEQELLEQMQQRRQERLAQHQQALFSLRQRAASPVLPPPAHCRPRLQASRGISTGCPPGSPLLQAKHMPLTVCIRLPKGVAGQACNSPKVIVVNKSYAAPNADVSEMVHAGQVCALVKTGTCGWILIMAHTGKLTWFPSSFATTFPEFSYTHPGLPPPQRAGSSCSLSSLDKYESSCTTASGIHSKTQSERARASVRGRKIVQK